MTGVRARGRNPDALNYPYIRVRDVDWLKSSVRAAAPGAMFAAVLPKHLLLCAGGGLAIGVAFRLFERTEQQKNDAQALRYLNILQRNGVGISVSAT